MFIYLCIYLLLLKVSGYGALDIERLNAHPVWSYNYILRGASARCSRHPLALLAHVPQFSFHLWLMFKGSHPIHLNPKAWDLHHIGLVRLKTFLVSFSKKTLNWDKNLLLWGEGWKWPVFKGANGFSINTVKLKNVDYNFSCTSKLWIKRWACWSVFEFKMHTDTSS